MPLPRPDDAALIGEVDGVRLFSPQTVENGRTLQTDGLDLPEPLSRIPNPYALRFGLGYELHPSAGEPMLGDGSFGHSGAGGRLGFAHPERQAAVAYTCTRLAWNYTGGADARWLPWIAALESALR